TVRRLGVGNLAEVHERLRRKTHDERREVDLLRWMRLAVGRRLTERVRRCRRRLGLRLPRLGVGGGRRIVHETATIFDLEPARRLLVLVFAHRSYLAARPSSAATR